MRIFPRKRASVALAFVVAVCGLALVLTSCVAAVGRGGPVVKVGEDANQALDIIHDAEARGEISSTGSGADWWDSLLLALGYVMLAGGGSVGAGGLVSLIAGRKDKKQDALPFVGANGQKATEDEVVAATRKIIDTPKA